MFGYRTPVKKDNQNSPVSTEETDSIQMETENPSTSNARQSIGETDTGKKGPLTDKEKPLGPPRQRQKQVHTQENIPTARRASTGVSGSPLKQEKPKFLDRVSEARACLTKGKLHLGNSRNLKTDIKSEVMQALERLYQLVKEAEKEKGHMNNSKKEQDKGQNTPPREKEGGDSNITKKLDEHYRLIQENNERMERLQEVLEKQQKNLEKMSYASVTAGPPRRHSPVQSALHSVIVSSKDDTETGEEVLSRIREAVKAKEEGVQVDRVRKAKDRKVIIGCKTEEGRQKVKERLKTVSNCLNVEEIENKSPLLILKNVLSYNSDEEIESALRKQNVNVFGNLDKNDDRLQVAYRKKTRNPHTCHVVIRVSTALWNRIMEIEFLHIDLQRVRVADQSPLVQCSLCLGYGHSRRFCTDTIERCSHCGGPHMRSECADWLAGEAPTCCNCTRAKHEQTEHNAFSQECPVRKRWDALARANIAYC